VGFWYDNIQGSEHLELKIYNKEEQPLETVEFKKEYGNRKTKVYNKRKKGGKIRRRKRSYNEESNKRDIHSDVERKNSDSEKKETSSLIAKELIPFLEEFIEKEME
jgi:hypothetical protein